MRQHAALEISASTPAPPPDRLIGDRDLRERVQLSRAQIWRLYSRGAFPRPVRVGARSLWSEREITEWIDRQLTERAEGGSR